jgi:hypothetical protein
MAHFAKLNQDNVVVQVIVINNEELMDGTDENEAKGIAFCQSLFGTDTRWVQTSYNGNFRKRYAGTGCTYDAVLDAFIPPKPEENPSWVVDPQTADWGPPIPRPTDTVYKWDEHTVSWIVVPQPYPSWTPQNNPLIWMAPIPYPTDGKLYKWDEPTLAWIESVMPVQP